jgi:hypothetical protein
MRNPWTILSLTSLCIGTLSQPAYAQDVEWIDVPLAENTYDEQERPMRTDTIEIPLGPFAELEYKLGMREGDAIVYSWKANGIPEPDLLYAEFHGHTEPEAGEPGTVMFYRQASGDTESGVLRAPFSGIHGWYLVNESSSRIVVELEVAGFYELIEQ